MATQEELAEMERLSSAFVPDQKGDLVGVRISSQRLTEEYAKADPVYASKTKNLPNTYPEYRVIKGDGNCGFRAIAFGYCEALLRIGDATKIRAEIERLKTLNNLLEATGQQEFMYEDWVEVTLELLGKMADNISAWSNETMLLQVFNDLESANAITQHFRMITSAHLKLNPDEYAPFVPEMDVETYCKNHVDPFYEEIEHVGVKALVDTIVNPAGIAISYLYLDRSEGEQATPYSFPVLDKTGDEVKDAPTIRLLYRPGHYDMLYQKEDLVALAGPNVPKSPPVTSSHDDVIVRTIYDIPQSQFPQFVEFHGLPGFDPDAQFNFNLSDTIAEPQFAPQQSSSLLLDGDSYESLGTACLDIQPSFEEGWAFPPNLNQIVKQVPLNPAPTDFNIQHVEQPLFTSSAPDEQPILSLAGYEQQDTLLTPTQPSNDPSAPPNCHYWNLKKDIQCSVTNPSISSTCWYFTAASTPKQG
ncbi:uncharacterized protein KY384_001125 [Bacidia gigantensis]|uniref:uncharacterized protein n=1 Tax=Bacidia gigantensis TaxID=2732470 RepID=UPI001D03C058|nr:uncharacterized protein KY384_001125 [Bacidia gigantensis]KAG8534281.1 hypothetical protein KY384_001125 [Bacidia gigantensis]